MIHHLTAIWKFRHFLLSLVRLDLRLRYKRSVLGVGWSLLNPISMTIVFTLVFSNLLGGGDWRDYAPFLLAGMTLWGFMREAAVTGCQALMANESYIRQSPLPYGLYPLRVVLGQAIHTFIGLAVVIGLIAFIKGAGFHPGAILWAIPPLLLLLVAAWAVATITAFAYVYVHDTQQVLEVGAQVAFFLTPVMYRPEVLTGKGLGWLVRANTVNLFLELIRTPLLTGEPQPARVYLYAVLLTAGLFALAAGIIARCQKRVIFRL